MRDTFQLVAGHIALDFANTLDNRYSNKRTVDLLPTYETFLAFATQSGAITGSQARKLTRSISEAKAKRILKDVRKLREALYFLFRSVVFDEQPKQSDLRALNRFLSDASAPVAVIWKKQQFLRVARNPAESAKGPLLVIVQAAADLLLSPDRLLICECNNENCRWLILDRSKNHTRRWCNMRVCGNRFKAQRFHARHRRGRSNIAH